MEKKKVLNKMMLQTKVDTEQPIDLPKLKEISNEELDKIKRRKRKNNTQRSDIPKGKIIKKFRKTEKEIKQTIKKAKRKGIIPAALKKAKTIGRNDVCICGSGKKYKQCCLRKGKNV